MFERFLINEIEEADIDAERQRSLELLSRIVDCDWIHEVGSTAVDGLIGKQDLDFLVRVPASQFEHTRQLLDKAMTRNPKQMASEIYQGYIIESVQDVAVQLTVADGPHDRFLPFLTLLKNNLKLRDDYNALKRKFHGQSMADYRAAKRRFIENALVVE